MTRLSLLMGLFMAVSVTGIVVLLAVMGNVDSGTMIYRGCVIFFIFGTLGTVLGSFLEILVLPATTELETEKLQQEMALEDSELQAELGDLLDNDNNSRQRPQRHGTPTDETMHSSQFKDLTQEISTTGDSATVS